MKKNNILYKIPFIVFGFLLIFSCESIDLDKTTDPFNLASDQVDEDLLLNGIEEDFVRQIDGDADYASTDNFSSGGTSNGDGLSLFGGQLTRMYCMSSTLANNYSTAFQSTDSDDEWTNAYAGIIANIRKMTPLAIAKGKTRHIAIAQFIEAYTMTAMVDFYGDIPYTEIGQGLNNLNPKIDTGASIYAASLALLDKSIINFTNTPSKKPITEVFYNNDDVKWIKAVNTLKMKLLLQIRLVDNTAIAKFNSIVASGNYITDSSDDLVYNWGGDKSSNPDTRHPRFGLNYTPTGAGDYMSNWFMGTMNTLNDPRIRYYFYRQRSIVPGQPGSPPDEQNLKCSLQSAPAHYAGYTFCSLPNGYWGRDHGDTEGTPPDGFLRTTFGVYPAGGQFDGNNFANVTPSSGAKGKGITPILLASWVNFMKAELAIAQNNTTNAKIEMLNGMTKSIDKVISFGANDASLNSSFVPTASNIATYKTTIETAWDAGNDITKWNILATQYFITVYGNGIESYNFYRRTGYPTNLQPNRSPNPGGFIRSFYYPANSVTTNSNVKQKTSQTLPVFWNTNASPVSN